MNRIAKSLFPSALLAALLLVAAMPVALGRPTDPPDSGNVVSPEVSPDRKITFRLKAPGAATVRIVGDFALNGVAMAKGTDGVWTYTTDILPTAIYGYTFSLDGVRIVDPGNLYLSSGAAHNKSYVEVPGPKDKPDFWEVRDVPHGTLHSHIYKSPKLGDRPVVVYTPPGYNPTENKTYPVIYLLHSATDNETYWFQVGRANFIMDNLIADGKAKPAIVVSNFGWPSIPPGPEEDPSGEVYYVNQIGDEILQNTIPFIEKEYRTGKQAKDRAILGFSGMGGCQALTIGLNNPGTFGYIAGLSCGFKPNQDLNANFKGLLADLEKSKTAFNLVKVEVGNKETGNVAPSQTVDKFLTDKGIKHEFVVTPDGIHSWVSWRGYFKDFMMEIFKD